MCLQKESRVLDAPKIKNDYYTNLVDWGKNSILAVALGPEIYFWNSVTTDVSRLFKVNGNNYPTSVSWSEDAKYVATGFVHSQLQIWDAETSKLVRNLEGHTQRIATLSWNNNCILTSGGHDKSIINHDGN
jgi:cell division cycle 20, cofactor of APC complex